jgi:hypothetical protein
MKLRAVFFLIQAIVRRTSGRRDDRKRYDEADESDFETQRTQRTQSKEYRH